MSRPRARFSLGLTLALIAAIGCKPAFPTFPNYKPREAIPVAGAEMEGVVTGGVHHPGGHPLEGAMVIAMSTVLPEQQEARTDAEGSFRFEDLPPGIYTIQVLYERGNVSETFVVGSGGGWYLRFIVDPDPPYRRH